MENKQIVVRKERSYVGCLLAGLREGTKCLQPQIKSMWPTLLLAILFPFPGLLFLVAHSDSMMRKWMKTGVVTGVSVFADSKRILRYFVREVVSFLLVLLCVALILFTIVILNFFEKNLWWALLPIIFILLVFVPFYMVRMDLAFSDKSYSACYVSYIPALRYYGSIFAYTLLSGILKLLVVLVCSFPIIIFSIAFTEAYMSEFSGENIDVPAFIGMLSIIAAVMSLLSISWSLHFTRFCDCLMWGNLTSMIDADEKERLEKIY